MAHHGRFRQITTPKRDIHREMHFARLSRERGVRGRRRYLKWVMALSVEDAKQTGAGDITLDDVAKESFENLKRCERVAYLPPLYFLGYAIIDGCYVYAPRFIRRAARRLITHAQSQIPRDRSLFEAMVKEGAPENPYLWHRPPEIKLQAGRYPRCIQIICDCQRRPVGIFNPAVPPPWKQGICFVVLEAKEWITAKRERLLVWSARCEKCGQWLYQEKSMGFVPRPLHEMYR